MSQPQFIRLTRRPGAAEDYDLLFDVVINISCIASITWGGDRTTPGDSATSVHLTTGAVIRVIEYAGEIAETLGSLVVDGRKVEYPGER